MKELFNDTGEINTMEGNNISALSLMIDHIHSSMLHTKVEKLMCIRLNRHILPEVRAYLRAAAVRKAKALKYTKTQKDGSNGTYRRFRGYTSVKYYRRA